MTSSLDSLAIPAQPDRYLTFRGIDFEGNMRAVLGHLRRYIDDPAHANPFWDRFLQRLTSAETGGSAIYDKLLLLHSHTYYMAELFEDHDDDAAITALKKLEEECF
ncbi:N(2)-fixation sustaining protein CowN [Hyphomicrobium sp. NDB2Meth4]|uniref:N(2)-fixation sustaining protein CowN n=1 Tax=Hyphomicrobium sp. NDB2Meth4 TaxID=1892846 RepID=UPI000931DF98|nr:N(2)-fixation sustaining protein CowN [Hyphomicrobium sp. NDB2Meth4]